MSAVAADPNEVVELDPNQDKRRERCPVNSKDDWRYNNLTIHKSVTRKENKYKASGLLLSSINLKVNFLRDRIKNNLVNVITL